MKNPNLDAACAVAFLALARGAPPEGISAPREDILCVRDAQRLVILHTPWQWTLQSRACFGDRAFTVACMDGEVVSSLARIALVIELSKKPGGKHQLIAHSIPTRAVHQFSENRLPRANLDAKTVVEFKSYGMKRARPGRAAKFSQKEVA